MNRICLKKNNTNTLFHKYRKKAIKQPSQNKQKQTFCYLFKKIAYISLFSKNNVLHLQKSTEQSKKTT